MVRRLLERCGHALRKDISAFTTTLRATKHVAGPPAGLLTYRRKLPGGYTRLHLRVQTDGSGLLFRDVSDVLHLNGSAAALAWLVLEDWDKQRALAWLGTH